MGAQNLIPLHVAVTNRNLDIVDRLLSKGADLNAKSGLGSTLLRVACDYHFATIINYSIHEGLDISEKNNDGQTPFSLLNPQRDN